PLPCARPCTISCHSSRHRSALLTFPTRRSSDLLWQNKRLLKRALRGRLPAQHLRAPKRGFVGPTATWLRHELRGMIEDELAPARDRKSTRLNSSHQIISYAVFCLKKKTKNRKSN